MPPDDAPQPPRTGMPVTLVFDDLRLRAKVEGANEAALELTVPHAPPALRRSGGVDVRLEFVGERGPCRLMGTATAALGDAALDPRVRVAPQGHPQLLLRSERVRAPVELEIEVDAGSGPVKRRTRDVRVTGALVSGPLQLEVEADVAFRLRIPGRSTPIAGTARVARVTEDGDVALQLDELGEEDHDDLVLAVFEAQRAKAG